MWNYEEGTYRCSNDHVFAQTGVEGVQSKVVRLDLPSRRERLGDVLLGFTACGVIVSVVVALVELL